MGEREKQTRKTLGNIADWEWNSIDNKTAIMLPILTEIALSLAIIADNTSGGQKEQ